MVKLLRRDNPVNLKIVFLVPTLRTGGLPSLVETLVVELEKLGHEVLIYNLGLQTDIAQEFNKNISVISGDRTDQAALLAETIIFAKWQAFVRKHQPDVIQSFSGISDIYLAFTKVRKRSCKIRSCINSDSFPSRPILGRIFEKYLASRLFDHFIAVTKDVQRAYEKSGVIKSKMTLIYNPIPAWVFEHRSVDNEKEESGPINLSFLGRLSFEKGPDRLLRWFKCLRPMFKEEVILNIGGNGVLAGQLHEMSNKLNLQDSIKFWGFVEDPRDFFAGSDIVINSSRIEGLPISMLEAAALGCPIVVSDTNAANELRELVPDVFVVPNQDEQEHTVLENLYKWIIKQVKTRKGKRNLYPHAIDMLSSCKVAEKYSSFYKATLLGKRI